MNQTLDFRPVYPPRLERQLPVWRQFVGEMRRNPLLNWPQEAFEQPYWFRRIAPTNCRQTGSWRSRRGG